VATTGSQKRLVTSNLVKLRGTSCDGQPVDEPLHTVSAGGTHMAEVRAFLIKYYGNEADGHGLDRPIGTVTVQDRFGLVTVTIDGEEYVIVDIGMHLELTIPEDNRLGAGGAAVFGDSARYTPAGAALLNGATNGRGGLGTIYVWAGGNGRESDDDSNDPRRLVRKVRSNPGLTAENRNLESDERSGDKSAKSTKFPQHLTISDTRRDPFADREFLTDKNESVNQRGHCNDSHIDRPRGILHGSMENNDDEPHEDKTTRPGCVKDVQPLRLFLAEDRGDDGVDESLDRAVAESRDEAADDEQVVGEVGVPPLGDEVGADAEDGPDQVAGAGEQHRCLVAHLVDEEAEENDAHGKRPDPDACEDAQLLLVQIKLFSPNPEEFETAHERKSRGDQSDKAAPEKGR
jgi:hypothetical protein